MTEDLLFTVQDGVAVITFNRPAAMNTLSSAMIEGLGELYRRCDRDDTVRVVVVTGAGKAFCAGADMSGGSDTFAAGGEQGRVVGDVFDRGDLLVVAFDLLLLLALGDVPDFHLLVGAGGG